ncbi:MAG: RHS repeat-associated core domain-containing protein [Prolixibacteraceae bacterium]|nr:RHS repeat-associated core domain-containing protein [Prolixibacteraceae bacterium]
MLGAGGEQLAVYNGVQVKFDNADNETERFVYMYLHSYISAGGQLVTLANGTKQFNIVDNLGSVRCIVSWDGTAVSSEAFDYKPFGDLQTAGEENRIGYFGEQRDKESDYFAMGFRLYDPEIGRFLAIDPLLDIQPSQTPYHYCFNNPTSFTDPTGLYPEKEKGDKVQAMEINYFVNEQIYHSLMNNKISYEENWEMARRQWRGLFYLISDKNYYKRMNGDGGGGGGSSSGRTGTNQSGNGLYNYLPPFIQKLIDNNKETIDNAYNYVKKTGKEVGWPIILGIDGNLRLGKMQSATDKDPDSIIWSWDESELSSGESFFGSIHFHPDNVYNRNCDYFSENDLISFGDFTKYNSDIGHRITTDSFFHIMISAGTGNIYGLGCTNARMFNDWQSYYHQKDDCTRLKGWRSIESYRQSIFNEYASPRFNINQYLIHYQLKYK